MLRRCERTEIGKLMNALSHSKCNGKSDVVKEMTTKIRGQQHTMPVTTMSDVIFQQKRKPSHYAWAVRQCVDGGKWNCVPIDGAGVDAADNTDAKTEFGFALFCIISGWFYTLICNKWLTNDALRTYNLICNHSQYTSINMNRNWGTFMYDLE